MSLMTLRSVFLLPVANDAHKHTPGKKQVREMEGGKHNRKQKQTQTGLTQNTP